MTDIGNAPIHNRGPIISEAMRRMVAETTPAERAWLAREVASQLAQYVTAPDIEAATQEIAQVVSQRAEHKRENQTGFGVLVCRKGVILSHCATYDGSFDFALAALRVAPETWRITEPDKSLWLAYRRALVTAVTGLDSGTIPNNVPGSGDWLRGQLATYLAGAEIVSNEDEITPQSARPTDNGLVLAGNAPGAIIVGDLIYSVSGLESMNAKEAAEAIAIYSLWKAATEC